MDGLPGPQGFTGATGTQGTQGATGAGSTGPQGEPGLDGPIGATGPPTVSGIPYTFSTTTTDSDPGAGILRLSNATQNASTVIRADLLDRFNVDWTTVLDSLDDSTSSVKGYLRLVADNNVSDWLLFTVSAVASPSGYRNITVTNVASSAANPFVNGESIRLQFDRTGDQGEPGMDGMLGAAGPAGATGATGPKASGQIYLTASGMVPAETNGAAQNKNVSGTNSHNYYTLDFDQTTQEFACATLRMPSDWDAGTITAEFDWTRVGTSTSGVVWALEAVAMNDGDTIATAYGTAQQIADSPTAATTLLMFQTSATPAITIADSPAAGDVVLFRVKRVPSDGSDTLAADAMLIGVMISYTRS